MKTFRIFKHTLAVLLLAFLSQQVIAKDTDDTLHEDIKSAAETFEKAIDQRNFKVAKEQLDVLFPLMKKEFKEAKKQIHAFEKDADLVSAGLLQKSLDRKVEIHDQLHSLVEASSASLRVQAEDAKALVLEYKELLEAKIQLLSSLN